MMEDWITQDEGKNGGASAERAEEEGKRSEARKTEKGGFEQRASEIEDDGEKEGSDGVEVS